MLGMESGKSLDKIDIDIVKQFQFWIHYPRYGVDIMNEDIADNYAACVW